MDNTDEKALNQNAGEEASVSTTPVEETKAPVEDLKPETETKPTGEEEVKAEEPKEEVPVKKGAEARIRELNAKAKAAEEKAQSLAQKLEELTSGVPEPAKNLPYTPQVQPGAEVSPEQYQADVTKTADALVQLRLNQYKVVENINKEAEKAVKEYPELDPESDQFDKELNESVTEAALSYVRANPYGSVKRFVDKLMKPYKRSLMKEVAEETETITKQVSQAALRPTPSKKIDKTYDDMSIKELEKELGVVY